MAEVSVTIQTQGSPASAMIITDTAVPRFQRAIIRQQKEHKCKTTVPQGDIALLLVIDHKRQLSPHWTGVMRLHSTPTAQGDQRLSYTIITTTVNITLTTSNDLQRKKQPTWQNSSSCHKTQGHRTGLYKVKDECGA